MSAATIADRKARRDGNQAVASGEFLGSAPVRLVVDGQIDGLEAIAPLDARAAKQSEVIRAIF